MATKVQFVNSFKIAATHLAGLASQASHYSDTDAGPIRLARPAWPARLGWPSQAGRPGWPTRSDSLAKPKRAKHLVLCRRAQCSKLTIQKNDHLKQPLLPFYNWRFCWFPSQHGLAQANTLLTINIFDLTKQIWCVLNYPTWPRVPGLDPSWCKL